MEKVFINVEALTEEEIKQLSSLLVKATGKTVETKRKYNNTPRGHLVVSFFNWAPEPKPVVSRCLI